MKRGDIGMTITESEFKERSKELYSSLAGRASKLKDHEGFKNEVAALIDESKALLKEGKTEEALHKYKEAAQALDKAVLSALAEPLANRLFLCEVFYLGILLLLGYLTFRWPHFVLWDGMINLHTQTAWFGALGGVTIALYGVYSHVQAGDFDPRYQLWYISKPIIGGIFGWFVYLVYYIGLISAQGVSNADIKTPELPFAIAFLAGFSERFTIKIIDRLMAVLTTWEEKPAAAPAGKTAGGKKQ